MRPQRTICQPAVVDGYGFWSGADVCIEFRPAPPNSGVVFVRRDLQTPIRIPAFVGNRVQTPRRTTLSAAGVQVEMVEHVLAACAGLQVDNCEIWVDQPEMPGRDGSSAAFTAALKSAGIVEQPALRQQLVVHHPLRVGDDESWIEAFPAAANEFSLSYRLDYGVESPISAQELELEVAPETFERELASARTFLLKSEADWLLAQGLGTRVTNQDVLVFGEQGPIENQLRFDTECVRHKMLDVVGDLSLGGRDIVGRVVAYRSGHQLNAELVSALLAAESPGIERKIA